MATPGDPTATPPPPLEPSPRPAVPVAPYPTTGTHRTASSGPGLHPSSGGGLIGGDWPAQATTTVVDLVDQVKTKTTGPIMTGSRAVVHGLLAGVLTIVVLVLVLIASVRFLDELFPSGVWLSYLVLGIIFTIVGTFVFRKRHSAPSPTP